MADHEEEKQAHLDELAAVLAENDLKELKNIQNNKNLIGKKWEQS